MEPENLEFTAHFVCNPCDDIPDDYNIACTIEIGDVKETAKGISLDETFHDCLVRIQEVSGVGLYDLLRDVIIKGLGEPLDLDAEITQ